MATKSFNRVTMDSATTGTSDLVLGNASAANVLTFAQAGAVNGDEVNYVIEDGANFEIGRGVLSASGTALTRATVFVSKASTTVSTAKLTLTGSARVRSAENADLFNHLFLAGQLSKTAAYTVVRDDCDKALFVSSATAVTISLTAAATLTANFVLFVRNDGVGAVTIDPNASETIDGALTLILTTGQSVMILGNGTNFRTMLLSRNNLSELLDVNLTTTPPVAGDGLTFNGTKWVPGAAGGGMFRGNNGTVGSRSGDIFRVNAQALTTDVTIGATENASAAGPITVNTGVTLTVTTGGTLTIL